MLCKKCGENIADTSKFCGYCGNPTQEILTNNNQNMNVEVNNSIEIGNEFLPAFARSERSIHYENDHCHRAG